MVLERTITLKGVNGRIDHLALDLSKRRLYVAELGNGTVEAVDLQTGAVTGRISRLAEPQGVAYLIGRDEIAVATGGDGKLRFFRAADLSPVASLDLGDDADNVRFDAPSNRLVVGYGAGALAVVDPNTRQVVRRVVLPAHPEGFQVAGDRAFVNLPDGGRTSVVDLSTGATVGTWPNASLRFNFPLALDLGTGAVAVVYRLPAKLVISDAASGARRQSLDTCGDADDLFFDGPRHRFYVVCGGGSVDVFGAKGQGYARIARVPSRRGARTGYFSPQLNRLFVAARAGPLGSSAAILVYRPLP